MPASATPLSVVRDGFGKAAFVSIAVDGVNKGVIAGEYQWRWEPDAPLGYDDTFYTYCIDVRNSLVQNDTVAIRSTDLLTVLGVPNAGGKAAWLFNTYAPGIRGAANSLNARQDAAALQVAIWEAMLDTTNDLSNGALKLNTTGDIKDKAKAYLLSLYNPDGSYKTSTATWLDFDSIQAQIVVLPGVPEPGTLLMLGSGFGVLIAVRRRRRQAAAV